MKSAQSCYLPSVETRGAFPSKVSAMTLHPTPASQPFGTLVGTADGSVEVYSSDYDTADKTVLKNRKDFRSYVDGTFMGYKWQCVELARRWMYLTRGMIFDDVAMAYEIFRLRVVRRVADGAHLPLHSFKNGSRRVPEAGAMLIWNESGEFETTGHVAIITAVTANAVRIIEQNVEDALWAEGTNWSRELPLHVDEDGGHHVACTFENSDILGWVFQTDDDTDAEPRFEDDPTLFAIQPRRTLPKPDGWLDRSDPAQAAFAQMMKGDRLATRDDDLGRYFVLSEAARSEIKRATNELHAMFLHATDWVLDRPDVLARFKLPDALLPRVQQSWNNRRTHVITGRFDFAMTEKGLKVYEYNVDSASCHMETGLVQGAWAKVHGVTEGRDPGAKLHHALVNAWQDSHVDTVLHIFKDDDPEEIYHAHYMASAAEKAGVRCKIINGVDGLGWDAQGRVVDPDGERIDWVWKTWAWETALDELRAEVEDENAFLATHADSERRDHAPRLIDVLLRPEVMVFEPLWTLIPSNKAILPILWELYPDHPYLLEAHFELTEDLAKRGYVSKPIVGRCGKNITLVDRRGDALEETGGQFEDRDLIYQSLAQLPEIDGLRVQVCSFSVNGVDASICVRCDPSLVITSDSDVLPLRIVQNDRLTA